MLRTNATPIYTGAVLIQESLLLPASLKLETSPYSKGWRIVTGDEKSPNARIDAIGWNFFFTAGRLEESAIGSLNPKTLRRALDRILRRIENLHFNAVEIGKIQTHRAFGMVPYISISAHARHIQRSEQLENDEQRKTAQSQSAWAIG